MSREFLLLRPTSHSGLPPIDEYPFRIRTCDLFPTRDFDPFRIRTYRSQVRPLITRDFQPSRINTYTKNSCNSFVFRTYENRRGGGLISAHGKNVAKHSPVTFDFSFRLSTRLPQQSTRYIVIPLNSFG
jgi:hypothetical protein